MRRRSTAEYPANWPAIANQVKELAGWHCIRCGHKHQVKGGYTLTVHHADMDPSNSAWWNLLALCQRCHLSFQNRVILKRGYMQKHTPWFLPYVAGYYAWAFLGHTLPREEIEANLGCYLALGQPWFYDQVTGREL